MRKVSRILFYVLLTVVAVLQVYPLLWIVLASVRDNAELSLMPFALPKSFTTQNYARVMRDSNVFTYIKNSGILTVACLILIVALASTVGFALAKMRFKTRGKVFGYFMIGLTIPQFVTLIPIYVIYSKLHLVNTLLGVSLPLIAFSLPMAVLLFKNFYVYVPDELIEAAIIDGCSIYRVYAQIALPISLNTIMSVVSMSFITVWNDYLFSLILINSSELKTITVGLQDFIGLYGAQDWGATFASICISTIPTLAIYFALNGKVTNGMTMGATKG